MHRVLALAALASSAVIAWAIVGGAAGALYAAAAALALVGLLLPPALKRQRRSRDDGRRTHDHPASRQPAPQRDASNRTASRRSGPLPGIRRLGFVRELEAHLAEQQDENRDLRERLRTELDAVRGANELLEQHRSLHEQARRRLEDSVARHGRERTLLERELEAIQALVRTRPTAQHGPALGATAPASASKPLEGGSRPGLLRPTMP
jgi:hypothetical protein